jgi:phage terminase large subunit-like protein
MRGPADIQAVSEGCYFDQASGQRVCDFIERFCRQSHGKWRGEKIVLIDWQRDWLMRLFGWKREDGLRRYATTYLEVPKKNGKSTLLSALVIYLVIGDGEGAPEVHLNAFDKEQAAIIFKEAAVMVRSSPELLKKLDVSDFHKRITCEANGGLIRTNSKDVDNKDGGNPSVVVFDELHRQKDHSMWNVYRYATGAREQPLTIAITTSGEAESGIWYEQREYSEKNNKGAILPPDITHLGVVYRALPEDNLDDESTWHKANPSLGITLSLSTFRIDLKKAKETPVGLAEFKRYKLGIITGAAAQFVELRHYEGCTGATAGADRIRGVPAWGGLDLSSVNDLSAFVIITGDEPTGFDVRARYWLPKDEIIDLSRQHKVPYTVWADDGWITLTDGNMIDYNCVEENIVGECLSFEMKKIFADQFNAIQLCQSLRDKHGLPLEFLQQGWKSLSPPTKELTRLILGGKIRFGADPVMRWMVGNARAVKDPAGNIKICKAKSRGKIDGLAATVNALAAVASSPVEPSVYEKRGLLFI